MPDLDPLSKPSQTTSPVAWKVEEPAPDSPAAESLQLFQPHPALNESKKRTTVSYARLSDTLRLYAGWLIAWYVLIFAFGSYQFTRTLPIQSDLLEHFFISPVLVTFAFGAFLFLLFTDIHRIEGRSHWYGLFLTLLGIGLVWLFAVNT